MRVQDWLRLFFAVLFLLGATANMYLLVSSPAVYESFADVSLTPIYQQLWEELVFPNLSLFLGLVILFELTSAALLVAKGAAVKVGLILSGLFMFFLVPFWWFGGALINLVFGVILLWLARFSYPRSILVIFREPK